MTPQHHLPADIERTSLSIITAELAELGLTPPPETAPVVKRVIHTTADFDYAQNLRFTPGAVAAGVAALRAGTPIVTDTNMALAGITKPGLAKLGGSACAAMNGANEEAVALFLQDKIGFYDLYDLVKQAVEAVPFLVSPTLEDILEMDRLARRSVKSMV